jgi:aromatic-L-amino-acid decarboxylase
MRALKLWFVIRDQGVDGCGHAFVAISRTRNGWRGDRRTAPWKIPARRAPADTGRPPRAAGATMQRRSMPTHAPGPGVNEFGKAFLTPAVIDGRWAVRVSIGAAETTAREHVADLWRLDAECADART